MENMESMFSTLLQLPLFQGLSQEDFTNILGKVKLHFTKHTHGDILIRSKDSCDKLVYLLQGKLTVITVSESENLTFIEHLEGPYLIEPYSLFGMNTVFKSSYIAQSDVNILSIDKSFVIKELLKYEIFRLNFINNICNRAQMLNTNLWKPMPPETKDKIIHFILSHSEQPEGEKILKIKMDDLAENLDDTRLNISKVLNDFQEQGLLQLRRKEIVIPDMTTLINQADQPG